MPWAKIDVRVGHPRDHHDVHRWASVRWTHPEQHDVAVLLLDHEVDAPEVLHWGRPVGNIPLPYQGLGYPSATFRDGQHKVEHLRGKLPPQSGGVGIQDLYVLDQEFAPEGHANSERAWSGASGSAVFCQDHLVGVVIHDDDAFANRRLHACPARTFTRDPAFAALLRRYGDGPPELVDITAAPPSEAAQDSRLPLPPEVTDPQTAEFFKGSWTGNEDPREFSEHVTDPGGYIFLGLGLFTLAGNQYQDWKGNTIGQVVCYVLSGLFMLIAARDIDPVWLPRALRRSMRERTLHIDSDGITTTDDAGRQHIPWSAIGKVAVRYADTTVGDYRLLALHLQMHGPNTEAPAILYRPAGWPEDARLPAVCRGPEAPGSDDWVPVCVLGPLPGPRRLDLKNAVSQFAKHPLESEKDW